MKIFRIGKRLGSIVLTLALVLTMGAAVMPSYAAGSGTATVSYQPAKDGKVTEEFTLYKVGHFERYAEGDVIPKGHKVGDAYLALDAGIPDAGGKVDVTIDKADYDDESKWTAAWQASAGELAKVIETTSAQKFTATANKDNGGVATFTGLEDGLYLLTGPMQEYIDTEAGENTYFTPAASFIMVLNHTGSLSMSNDVTKKYTEETVKEYIIHKAWADAGHEALRPESVDVKLSRRDSSVQSAEWEEVETVTLSEDNEVPWTYEWKSEPKYEWKWEEIMSDEDAIHYIVSSSAPVVTKDNKKYVTITNTYTKRQLELTKILKHFLENGDNSATFAFEIRGYMGEGENERLVYTGSAGINFAKDGTGSITKLVDNIPVNLTRLEVEEVYSGNYKVSDPKKKVQNAVLVDRGDEQPPIYTVTFENEFNDEVTIKGGIVNKYTNEEGKIVLTDKDYGKVPSAQEQ